MDQTTEGAFGSSERCKRCDRCIQMVMDKVVKLNLQVQFDALISEGFKDEKLILKALKKNKGDVVQAAEFLKNPPLKKERRPRRGEREDRPHEEKKHERKCKKDSEEYKSMKNEKCLLRRQEKLKKMIEENPKFEEFNQSMSKLGFEDPKKNFKALQKSDGDQVKAASQLKYKKMMNEIVLLNSVSKGQFTKVYLDCNNCFYIEPSFLKSAVSRNYLVIEEKIATLMKLFQSSYGSQIEVVLVFDDSVLMKDHVKSSIYLSQNFKMVNARPSFKDADDALVNLASAEFVQSQSGILYITSDRLLQARLIEQNAKNLISSKTFFNQIKENIIGGKSYSAIVDQSQ